MGFLTSKVLWIVGPSDAAGNTRLLQHAQTAGITTVCLRSTSPQLPGAIGAFHAASIGVYAWRWPAVVSTATAPHHFADDEAKFVVQTLIPAKLDGYMVDPESDTGRAVDDWNQAGLSTLAKNFCTTIKNGAAAAGLTNFRFGTTSGCSYPDPNNRPKIPWAEFVAASDVLLPQSYWRMATNSGSIPINGGTPAKAVPRGLTSWGAIASGKPIVPMAGEIDLVTPADIAAYGTELKNRAITEGHFYADSANVSGPVLNAIAAL